MKVQRWLIMAAIVAVVLIYMIAFMTAFIGLYLYARLGFPYTQMGVSFAVGLVYLSVHREFHEMVLGKFIPPLVRRLVALEKEIQL